jgi:RTX calcium-binding nonapeptide repeat (4 copies)/Calx-beta domain
MTATFDFVSNNYSVVEGNSGVFTTNATVRITRTGNIDGIDKVQLKLTDDTAKGNAAAPTQNTNTGVSTSVTPYLIPAILGSGVSLTSILTVGDSIGGYKLVGSPDGLGAFDNGDGTFTVLMNHELANSSGVVRRHGGKGAFVSSWVINKSDLSVVSGGDLIQNVYAWNSVTQKSNSTISTVNFNRFCSADLSPVTAYYNTATGLGSQERIFMSGEEGSSTGYQLATIATGVHKGDSYILGKFNPIGVPGIASWENALANPFAQDKTVVIGNNDGGSGIYNNAIALYVGTKQNTGTEIDKAGLTNGSIKFVNVAGNPVEIADVTTSGTNITDGTAFTLSTIASTTFSRPEDGAWNPLNPNQYFFATADRFDAVTEGISTQIGRSRLWRLNFTDITNPDQGGTIDLLLDGTEGGNMFDNVTVDKYGHVLLQEDVGSSAHNSKIWQYDIATDTLKLLAKHDPARFGDIGVAATAPFNINEESSGIIDAQDVLGPGWFLLDTQAHYNISGELVEGGQLQALFNPDTYKSYRSDYNNKSITVTFNPGETYQDVQVPIAGDLNIEGDEIVNLALINPSTGSFVGTTQPNTILVIQNDDIFGIGDDTILGGNGNDYLNGLTGNDSLEGGAGNDVLDGSGDNIGIDHFSGGMGDDIYGIHSANTIVVEDFSTNGGNDTVWTAVNYTLSANVENMYLVGSITGVGNYSNNIIAGYGLDDHTIRGLGGSDYLIGGGGKDTIDGGIGSDYLNGGLGADVLIGGAGNDVLDGSGDNIGSDQLSGGDGDDIYGVHSSNTVIIEDSSTYSGNDSVWTAVSYSLTANIENMYLVGAVNGVGNASANLLIGYGSGNNNISGLDGDDTIDGGAGSDDLFGGNGNDVFIFSNPTQGVDIINDFGIGNDQINISLSGFGGIEIVGNIGILESSVFTVGTIATSANHHFIYDNSSGFLFFDEDGIGGVSQMQIAQLINSPDLSNSNFFVSG